MKNLIVAVMLALLPATARAASFTCETVAGPLNLCIPKVNTDWPSWSSATINTFRLIGAGSPVNSTGSVHTADLVQTRRISGVSTGTPNIWISSPTIISVTTQPMPSGFLFFSSGSVLIQSTGSIAGQSVLEARNQSGSSIWNVTQAGNVVSGASVTASAFYGGAATLTGALSASSATLTGTGATIYSLTSSSGVHVLNGRVKLESGALVEWPDGTTQVTAPASITNVFLKFVSSMTTADFTITPALPYDDTIPQISEGGQVLVATMTPTSASSIIKIEGVINVVECTNSGNSAATVCIFKDSDANALACFFGMDTNGIGLYGGQVAYNFITNATNTTTRNYSVRVGYEAASSLCINRGLSNGRKYGGVLTSTLFLSEITP